MNFHSHAKDAFFGAFLSMLVLAPALVYYGNLPYTPYRAVEISEVKRVGNKVHISADFVKNGECIFSTLAVFVGTLGQWTPIAWEDTVDIKGPEDRLIGRQTLSITADLPWGASYSELEVRTRHYCGPDRIKTDKIFLNVELTQ